MPKIEVRKQERRLLNARMEVRATPVDGGPTKRTLVGHAAMFDQPADIGGWFIETVRSGAFTRTIAEDDIRALFNHNPDHVLGRNKAKTLRLQEDNQGLAIEIDVPDTTFARDLSTLIERGDVSQMSFGFEVREVKTKIEKDVWYRDLLDVILYDVSPVTFPAYEGTDIAARAGDRMILTAEEVAKEFRRGPEAPPVVDPEAWQQAFHARRRRIELADV